MGAPTLQRMFPTAQHTTPVHPACHLASPLAWATDGGWEILSAVDDSVFGLDPETGAQRWSFALPAPPGEKAFLVATPALVGHRLVVGFHTTADVPGNREVVDGRLRHRVLVLDLHTRNVDPDFDVLELQGSVPSADGDGARVAFEPAHALGRAALIHAALPGDGLGRVYVTFGNALDLQPWHGFAFEVDLDAWRAAGSGAAITGLLVDTPETQCGPRNSSGSRERRCGGGLWAPSGPLLLPTDGGYDVVLASGNGQLDLARGDYANTLMRAPRGLAFDPACDPAACAAFQPDDPSPACSSSCLNLFIPRMPADENFADRVSDGRCQGLSLYECWARLDYIGGSTPALLSLHTGARVLVYPAKDGALYLVDADHLGTQYQRVQLVPVCGTATSPCTMDWAGMIVTQPTVTTVNGQALVLTATFMPDGQQEAAVFAHAVDATPQGPRLREVWRWPRAGTAEARTRFRHHPSRIARVDVAGRAMAVVVDAVNFGAGNGRLLVLDLVDGALLTEQALAGRGYRFVMPLVLGDRVYAPSCASNAGDSSLEGYRLLPTP